MSAILTGIVLLLIFVRVLRGMLDRVLDGRPFDPANVRALHLLAFLSVAGPIALQVLQYGVARHVLSVVEVQGIDLSPPFDLDLTPFFVALLLEALASVFSHGADLETDRSLTI